jgi:hypothetical protein
MESMILSHEALRSAKKPKPNLLEEVLLAEKEEVSGGVWGSPSQFHITPVFEAPVEKLENDGEEEDDEDDDDEEEEGAIHSPRGLKLRKKGGIDFKAWQKSNCK